MTIPLTPQQALQQYFGFDQFREGQEATVQRVLQGQHTLLVMPTGSGKSLAYQLPALLLPGLTLVISPLIALMKDQVDGLVERGVPATYINSSLPSQEANQRMRAVREGHVKLLYIAPERLRSRHFTGALAKTKVSLLAVDEAHCISQWGHDFRPDYLQVGPTWQAMGRPTLLATTATATPEVQADIIKLLGASQSQTIVTGFNRPNLTFRVNPLSDERAKLQALQALLGKLDGSAIVYTATRRNTDEVADFIQAVLGKPTRAYHAGLDRQVRYQVQTDFMADRIKIVVATNAFGMGVDKADVRTVIHYNMPATVEAYYQEAGRAGRDGQPAECVLLFALDDLRLQEWMITSDTPTYEDLQQLYHQLSRAANGGEIYFTNPELAEMTGLHPVKIRVVLSELELAGAIHHLGDQGGYSHWKVLSVSDSALRERSQAVEARAKVRLGRLNTMVNYVHLFSCRRSFLLNYFGDASPPRSPRCCDNHTDQNIADLPRAVTPQEWFPLIVLETVRSLLPRTIGRNRLAQLLNGSRAKPMQQFGYDRHKFYGKLNSLSKSQVADLIAALTEGKYLQIEGGEMPVLALSPLGLEALEARAALPIKALDLPAPDDAPRRAARAQRADQPHTSQITLNQLRQGLTPAQIASERGLTEQTVYGHLAHLIVEGQLDLAEVVSPQIETQVLEAVKIIGSAFRLAPLKAVLPEEIGFGEIRCVLTAHPELPRHILQAEELEQPEQRLVALGETGDPEHLPEILQGLRHAEANVRRLAASALGKIADAQAVESLLSILTDEPHPQVRQYLIRALGKIGDPRAQPTLEQIAADPAEKEYNRTSAQNALQQLQLPVTSYQPTGPALPVTNQQPQPPISPASPSPIDIILDAVAKLGGTLGRTGLAQFLNGSRAAWLESFTAHSAYGQLTHLPQRAILDMIDALITDGRLLTTGGIRPKLIVPEQQMNPSAIAPQQENIDHPTNRPAGQPTTRPNPAVLDALRRWRTEQARTRKVAPFIILSNNVLEVIAAQCPTELEVLQQIRGIGPAKLSEFGLAVLGVVRQALAQSEGQN